MRRLRLWIVAGIATVVVLAVVTRIALPSLVRWLAISQLRALTGREASIDQIRLNLHRGRFEITGFRLADRGGAPPLIEIEEIDADIWWRYLLQGRVRARDIDITAPTIRIARIGPRELNISDLIAGGATRKAPIVVMLDRLRLTRGSVVFEDRVISPPRVLEAKDLTLEVRDLSTLTDTAHGTAVATLTLSAAPVALKVNDIGLSPIHARATLTVRDLDLAPFLAYIPRDAPVTLTRGRLDADLALGATGDPGLTVNGDLTFTDTVLLRQSQAEPFVTHRQLRATLTDLSVRGGALAIRRLALDGAPKVADTSVSPPVRLDFTALTLDAEDVTWPAQRAARLKGFGAVAGGGISSLEGTFDPGTLAADMRATFSDVDVTRAASYLPADAPFTIAGGRLGAAVTLKHERATGVRITADGALADLAVARRRAPDLLATDRRLGFTIRELVVKDGTVAARRLALAGAPSVTDRTRVPSRRLDFRALRLDVGAFTWPLGRPVGVGLHADLPEAGTLAVGGSAAGGARTLDLTVDLRDAAIAPYQAWLPIEGPLGGRADAALTVAVRLADTLELSATGSADVREVVLGPVDDPVATVAAARATGIDVRWPTGGRVARITIEKPTARLEREPDGSFLLRTMLTPRPAAPDTSPADDSTGQREPVAGEPPLVVSVGEVVIGDGTLRLVDRSGTPFYSENISRLAMTATGFTTAREGRAEVAVQAVIGATGILDLKGVVAPRADPFFLELEGELREFPLPRTNPFFRRFFDWLLQRGSLSTRVHYRIVGDQLEARNGVRVERLSVERDQAPVKSDRKLGLPLGLIVSMATDSRGDIEFSLPVSGRLGSPDFSLGDAVIAALKNALVNLVTGPFRAIGRIFGTDESVEELRVDPVEFEPGSPSVAPAAETHLQRVADFLRASPNVKLALRSVVSAGDLATLKTGEVTARIQRVQREEKLGSFDEAALALFRARFPAEPVPADSQEIVNRLRDRDPIPEGAARELAARRLETARRALIERGGIEGDRVRASVDDAELGGPGGGRVELEISPP